MYKLAVFDMDGTLLDSLGDLRASVNFAMRELGFPERTADDVRASIGNGRYRLLERLLPEGSRGEGTVTKAMDIFNTYYAEHSADLTREYEGASAMLGRLRAAGIKIAILSNKPDSFTKKLAESYFPGLIDVAYGMTEDAPLKPDPSSLRRILELFAADKAECVYIGDSDVDILTAKNAGVDMIAVSWGYCTIGDLKTAGAKVIVDKMQDVEKIVLDKRLLSFYTVQ